MRISKALLIKAMEQFIEKGEKEQEKYKKSYTAYKNAQAYLNGHKDVIAKKLLESPKKVVGIEISAESDAARVCIILNVPKTALAKEIIAALKEPHKSWGAEHALETAKNKLKLIHMSPDDTVTITSKAIERELEQYLKEDHEG